MKPLSRFSNVVCALILALCTGQAGAQTVLPPGSILVVFADGAVEAQFISGSAGFDNRLFLDAPTNALGEIFHNHSSAHGEIKSLGTFSAGSELLFRDNVSDSGTPVADFYTGPGTRNPDALVHARITRFTNAEAAMVAAMFDIAPETILLGAASHPFVHLVGFEDLPGVGDGDFNDMVFLLTNVTAVPEPTQALMLLAGLGVLGMLMRRRRS